MTTKRIRQTVRERAAVAGGTRFSLELRADALGEAAVPALLLIPDAPTAAPAALLLHGYTSHKEMMSDRVGRALLGVGIASIAIDLPLHGERMGPGGPRRSGLSPIELMRNWKLALAECAIALRYLAARSEMDRERLSIVGYSMGSFLGVTVAARERAVRAVVLAAGGDLPDDMPLGMMVRTVVDPVASVRKLDGTPLLMMHGRRDRTVTPSQAQRLFDAAREPKELRWWDAGHHLPAAAIGEAAVWLAEQLGALGRRRTG
jgi:uncharacterized protein